MASDTRIIEIDDRTADILESRAAARGVSVSVIIAELADASAAPAPADLERLRAEGRGPWSPAILAEDARRLADYDANGVGVPWPDVKAWIESWGTPPRPSDSPKYRETFAISQAMEAWREEKRSA